MTRISLGAYTGTKQAGMIETIERTKI